MKTLKGKICKVYDTPLMSHRRFDDSIMCEGGFFVVYREPLKKYDNQVSQGRVWRVHYTHNNITYMKHFSDEQQAIKSQWEAVELNGFYDAS